jgi:hypothetical protein
MKRPEAVRTNTIRPSAASPFQIRVPSFESARGSSSPTAAAVDPA